MTRILRLETFGKHIDLDKLIAIDNVDAEYTGEGAYASFKMYFQLMDNPLEITYHFTEQDYEFDKNKPEAMMYNHLFYDVDGHLVEFHAVPIHKLKPVHEMQLEVDNIVRIWNMRR